MIHSSLSCILSNKRGLGEHDGILVANTLKPRQKGRHFADDIFNCVFLNENVWISINISLKFVPKGPIDSIPALVRMMAWRRSGDKPLSEPMVVNLLTHIRVTRPQWLNCERLITNYSIGSMCKFTIIAYAYVCGQILYICTSVI